MMGSGWVDGWVMDGRMDDRGLDGWWLHDGWKDGWVGDGGMRVWGWGTYHRWHHFGTEVAMTRMMTSTTVTPADRK